MRSILLFLLATSMLALSACAAAPNPNAEAEKMEAAAEDKAAESKAEGEAEAKEASAEAKASADIVETAAAAGTFNTLLAAAQAAELVETLKGDGPLTVFAPTDEAFAALPAGTVEDLLKPENKAKLQAILTYHVVAGEVMAADVIKLTEAPTVQGQAIAIAIEGESVMINDAKVIQADIVTSNGVIHVIDKVILPPM